MQKAADVLDLVQEFSEGCSAARAATSPVKTSPPVPLSRCVHFALIMSSIYPIIIRSWQRGKSQNARQIDARNGIVVAVDASW